MGIVFLNCFLRSPGWIFHDSQDDRIKLIPYYTIMDNKTLIGLCEVFGSTYGTQLKNLYAKYNYTFVQAKDKSSGLAFVYPNQYVDLIDHTFEKYRDSKLPDSLVNKGFMHCVIKYKNCDEQTHIIITHLQATYSNEQSKAATRYREFEIRKNQLIQLHKYLCDNNIKQYILMGDFNIDLKDILFPFFKKLFNVQNYLEKSTHFDSEEMVDFIIIKNKDTKKYITKRLDKRAYKIISTYNKKNNKTLDQISDHYGIYVK